MVIIDKVKYITKKEAIEMFTKIRPEYKVVSNEALYSLGKKRRLNKKDSAIRLKKIKELRDNEFTLREIAIEVDLSYEMVRLILKNNK